MQARIHRWHPESSRGGDHTPPRHSRLYPRLLWGLIPFLCLHFAGCGTLRPRAIGHEIDLRFVNGGGKEPLIEPIDGWSLTLSLRANESKLLGISWPYPANERTGFLVFEDPDGCPSWLWECKDRPQDETMVKFTPGLLFPEPDDCTGQPKVLTFDRAKKTNEQRTPIGPCVGSTRDSYGYGPHPHLPGLVVVADAGPGVVTDEHFDRPSPHRVRNLAGFFHSVTYELKDSRGRTSILAHMNVPRHLLLPVRMIDQIVDDRCGGKGFLTRVDGRPAQCSDQGKPVVTLRAFVVNGKAPAELADLNGDGVVDMKDAEKDGAKLLSEQAVLRVWQLRDLREPPLFYDFDGNGRVGGPNQLPPDPGSLTSPPRKLAY